MVLEPVERIADERLDRPLPDRSRTRSRYITPHSSSAFDGRVLVLADEHEPGIVAAVADPEVRVDLAVKAGWKAFVTYVPAG